MDIYLTLLKSKIHGATVVESRLDYDGSLTIDEEIMEVAGIRPGERVLVANLTNGSRFETYAIKGLRGSGAIHVNGAAAHHAKPGDRLIIMSFALVPEKRANDFKPTAVYLDKENRILKVAQEHPREKSVVQLD